MTRADPHPGTWRQRAACAGRDTNLWFGKEPKQSLQVCARCPVRAECLYDALIHETDHTRYGIWGGLTAAERRALPALQGPRADVIAALRELLPAIEFNDPAPPERTDPPMSATPPADTAAAPAADTELVTTTKLLRWAAEHQDPKVQEQAAHVETVLTELQQRYKVDQELAAITTEAQRLEQQLAQLRAREAQLAPAKPKKTRKPVDYPAAEVRAWAAANGHDCPPVGRVPKAVVDAWKAAHENRESTDA